AKRGYSGVVRRIAADTTGSALSASELESRLIELGFVEGARVQVLHEGAVGRDPIAVRVENITIAVRRREAMAIIKVANYPGVTVERKEGFFVTPMGRQVSLVDLPGTYSLRGRSPDEEITRDFVLGKATGETVPDLVLCVADATNLRLTIRLLLELKRTGRPMILVLNMFDIATRRGINVDVARLAGELGVP
ncbi:hypothetical protein KXV85_001919, partial [Aspergillus fumigatus]